MLKRSASIGLACLLMFILSAGSSLGEWLPFGNAGEQANPSLEILSQTSSGLTVEVIFPGMMVNEVEREGALFHTLQLPGGGRLAHVGLPELPTYGRFIAVPRGAEVEIELLESRYEIFSGYRIHPFQKPLTDQAGVSEDAVFVVDSDLYRQDRFFPEKVVEVDSPKIIRGVEARLLTFLPVHYNPARGELQVFSRIKVTIRFRGGGSLLDESARSPYFENLYQNLLLNYDLLGTPTKRGFESTTRRNQTGCEYLIISDPLFEPQAEKLSLWKNRSGILTWVVTTEVTGSTAEEIRDYVQTAYDTWDIPPSFVLLLGDAEFIPVNYITPLPYWGRVGTDLYYATVDGSDYFPDIYHGRISVDTPQQAGEVLQKIIDYQRDPVDDEDFYHNSALASYFEDPDDNGYEDRFFVYTSEALRDFLLSEGYGAERIYCTNSSLPRYYYYGDPIPFGISWNGNAAKITSWINSGTFIFNHRDHGTEESWWHPPFSRSQIDSLANGRKTPVVICMSCGSCWFDNETDAPQWATGYDSVYFCETFERKYPGGAVGTFGHTRPSWSGYNDELNRGLWDGIWTNFDPSYPDQNSTHPIYEPMYQMGTVLNFSKFWMYDKYYLTGGQGYPWGANDTTIMIQFEMFHYLGDPTMEIWTAYPAPMTVSHPDEIELGAPSMTVEVSEDEALVCASMEGEILSRAYSSGGSALLDFGGGIPDTGRMDIVVTKHDFRPYEGEVRVLPPSQALTVEVIPDSIPVVVHQGGYFGYVGVAINSSNQQIVTDFWAMADVPGIGRYGPLKTFPNVRIPPYDTISDHFNQHVRNSAPLGDYFYWVYCGDYPSVVIDSSGFPFEVLAAAVAGTGATDWLLTGSFRGDDFPELPSDFALSRNYPNPFNASTVIEYQLPMSTDVKLQIYNLLGKKVATLVDGRQQAGYRSVTWDASQVSSGIYFYKLSAGDFTEIRRMMLVK